MYKRKRYPRHWPAMAQACKDLAGWQCQRCQVPQGRRRKSRRSGNWYRVHLHAAHVDHDPENPAPRLACLCERCHGRYDWAWRVYHLAHAEIERQKHRMLLRRRDLAV